MASHVFFCSMILLLSGATAWGTERGAQVVPLWQVTAGAIASGQADSLLTQMFGQGMPPTGCSLLGESDLTSGIAGVYLDVPNEVTHFFTGDAGADHIVRLTLDVNLVQVLDTLPVSYGVVWLAVDLDLDGNIELVVQRGDPGVGGDGYLDILSAPDWVLRRRFVMAGMKVEMNPVAADIDGDPHLELYITPLDLLGSARAQLIDYYPVGDTFGLVADIPAPLYTGGPAAVGDFDEDGRTEFISGFQSGYELFEYSGGNLTDIGTVGGTYSANTNYAAAARPEPTSKQIAIIGFSQTDIGYLYQLLEASGDNSFGIANEFAEVTGWSGIPPCFAVDIDCDGLEELVMTFYPEFRIWEWDVDSQQYTAGCSWSSATYGTFARFHSTDLNQDGLSELGTVNHLNVFRAFTGECTSCTNAPQGLVGWWPLDETSGDTTYDIWADQDGRFFGTPSLPVAGKVDAGLDCDGVDDYALVPDTTSLNVGLGDWSIDAWVTTVTASPQNPVLSKYAPSTSRGWSFWVDNGDRLAIRLADGGVSDYLSTSSPTIADGQWHHVAVTVDRDDASGVKFYLDGNSLGNADPTAHQGDLTNVADLLIGRTNLTAGDSVLFEGTVDEVRLYERALSALEVRSVVTVDSLGNCKPEIVICDCPAQADLDTTGFVDSIDIATEIDVVFFGNPDPQDPDCPVSRGDFNADEFTDSVDLSIIIDHVFFGQPGPVDPCGP